MSTNSDTCGAKNKLNPTLMCSRPKSHAGAHVCETTNGAWGWPRG